MAISQALLGAYTKVEDGFYSMLDFLDGKGIPVYAYADFLDNKGIPAFPFTIAVIAIAIALVLGIMFFGGAWNVELRLGITDNENSGLYGVQIAIFDETERQLTLPSKTFGNNDVVSLSGLRPGMELTVKGAKTGYKNGQALVKVTERQMSASLVLEKIIEPIIGSLRFIDEETGDVIRNAKVTARWDSKEIVAETDSNGVVRLVNIPKGEAITVQIDSDAYETDEITKTFDSNNLYEVALVPKAAGLLGKSTLLVNVYDAATKLLLQNSRIEVYDKSDSGLITDVVDKDGQATLTIEKGTSIRIAVSKENYVKYDSSESGDDRTLRLDEETWDVYLQKGGSILQVNVLSRTDSMPIMNAEVMLFNSRLEMIDYNKTGFSGSVVFRDLNADFTYFVAAYNSNYLPARMKVVPIQTGREISLSLERITTLNSATLGIIVSDSKGNAANDAVLNFYEIAENEKQPAGIPQMRTDITGYAAATLAIGANIFVNAVKAAESADGNIIIQAATFNKLSITLTKPANIVVINILDATGAPLKEGNARVEDALGNVLFDGNISNGYVIVDTQGNKFLNVHITTADGKEYEEEINVENKDEATIQIGEKTSDTLAPQIKLLGVFDASEKEVKGISKGQDYYLKFETVWPAGKYKAGVHVRVGNDAIGNADSDDVGILGFNVIGARYFYGRTYSPLPEPGNEGIDLQNSGAPGSHNKWLELYFDSNPNGTRIIKVRINAKETIEADSINVHYRAWTIIANSYYRTPEDALLADAQYTSQRTGLYASTIDAQIPVFETLPSCENELCASYKFIDAFGSEFSPENFKAVKGNVYALEIALKPDKDVSATVKLSTSRTAPKISFTGSEVQRFTEISDNNKSDTELQIDDVQALAGEETKIWAYFKANLAENTYITSQIISLQSVLGENFYFNIYVEKELYVETIPKDVLFGQDFRIAVKDVDGIAVEKAQLQLKKASGELLQTIVGDATADNGLNGQYLVKNGFDAGILVVEVSADGYKAYTTQIAIGKEGLLSIAESIEVDIPKGTESAEAFADLSNTSSELIDAIDYEIVKSSGFPEEMEITVAVPSSLPSGTRQNVTVIAEYSGKKEREHAEADLIIRGTVAGNYITSAKTRIIATYNKELEQGCLEFSVPSLKFYLLDDKGSSESAELTAKNTCNVPLTLDPEIRAKGSTDKDIIISADSIVLGAAGSAEETATIRIDASNELDRKFFNRRSFSYEIIYKSDALTKTLPVEVVIWNKYFALTAPSNIEMWLAQTQNEQFAISEVPLFIRNGSEFEISHITFSMEPGFLQNVNVEFLPKYPVDVLQKGRTLSPPVFIVAKSDASKGQVVQGTIVVRGTINGTEYELRRILLTIHVSAPICLKVIPESNPIEFSSTKVDGQILEAKITAYNTCNEEIRIAALEPKDAFATNPLSLIPGDLMLQPMQKADMRLALTKNQAQSGTLSAFLAAFMVRSFKWTNSERFTIKLELGKSAELSGPSTEKIPVKYCDKEGYADVKFPKIAKTDNCDTAYCDAEQFASFLIKRIESKMNDAKLKIMQYGSEVFNTNCDRFANYCMFSQLGIQTETFTAYMQLDNLSDDMLKSVINSKSSMLNAYYVQYVANSQEFETNVARSGWGNHLAISGQIKGCGRYKIKIDGSAQVQGSALTPEGMSILVQVISKEATAECENYIYNAMNFLPLDASYGVSDSKDTWYGTVANNNDKLNEIASDFAKTLFNKEERLVISSPSNHIQLAVGGVEGAVVQLSLQSTGAAASEGRDVIDAPKTLYANINEALQKKAEQQKEIAKEAGKAIRELKNAAISKDSCISSNLLSLKLRSTKEIGEFKIENCKSGNLKLYIGTSCCDYNVASDLSEKVLTNARALEVNQRGISKLWVESLEEKREISASEALPLKWLDAQKKYKAQYKLCVRGDKFLADAQGKEIAISANSKEDPARVAEEQKITLQVCGMHPYDLLNEIGKAQAGEYYATVGWKGMPESAKLSEILPQMLHDKALDEAKKRTVFGVGAKEAGQVPYEEQMRSKRVKGILRGNIFIDSYLGGCITTSVVCSTALAGPTLGLSWVDGLKSIVWNCLPGATWAVGREYSIQKNLLDFIKSGFREMWSGLRELGGVEETSNPNDFDEFYNSVESQLQGEKDLASRDDLRTMFGINMGTIILHNSAVANKLWKSGPLKLNPQLVKSIADTEADSIVEAYIKNIFDIEKLKGVLVTKPSGIGLPGPGGAPGGVLLTKVPALTVDPKSGKLGGELAEVLKKEVNGQLTTKLNQVYNRGELLALENYNNIRTKLFEQTASISDDYAKLLANDDIIKSILNTKGTEAAKALSAGVKELDKSIVETLSKESARKALTTIEVELDAARNLTPSSITAIDSMQERLATQFITELKNELGAKATVLTTVDEMMIRLRIRSADVKGLFRTKLLEAGKKAITVKELPPEVSQYLIEQQMGVLPKNIKEELISKKVAELRTVFHKTMGNEGLENLTKDAKRIKGIKLWKGIGNLLKTRQFWGGVGCGVAANLGGLAGWSYYWRTTDRTISPSATFLGTAQGNGRDDDKDGRIDEELCDGVDNDMDGAIDEDCRSAMDVRFVKYGTYKINIGEDKMQRGEKELSNKSYVISAEPIDPKDIPADAKRLDSAYCDGKFAEKELRTIATSGEFASASKKMPARIAAAYEQYAPTVAYYAQTYNVPEILIAAVMAAESTMGLDKGADSDNDKIPDYIAGCGVRDKAKFVKNNPEANIDCSAKALARLYAKHAGNWRAALEEYEGEAGIKEAYATKVLGWYKDWTGQSLG